MVKRSHGFNQGENNPRWKDGRTLDSAKYYSDWYKKNKQKKIDRMRISKRNRRMRNRAFIRDYKQNAGCGLCGEHDPDCLQFHHVDSSKEHDVSQMMDFKKERILNEISKCDVLCLNCHMKLHRDKRGIERDVAAVTGNQQSG